MDDVRPTTGEATPLWKRIVDFPLTTMVIAVGLFIAASALGGVINKYLLAGTAKPLGIVLHGLVYLILVFATYKLAIRHLGTAPKDDLPLAGAARGLGSGLIFGMILFSLVVGAAALFGVYDIVGQGSTAELVTALFAMAILPGFMEEMLFRGIQFRWLEQFGGSWFALALTSALFGLGHIMNPNATALSSFAIAIEAGILLGGAYMLTRNLWMTMGLHAAWNFTQGEIFDVNVSGMDVHGLVTARMSGPALLSGGSFGLEASLIAMVIATAAGLFLVARAVRQQGVVRPMWVRRRLTTATPLVSAIIAG